jgi:hypothetical protein
MDHIFQKCVYRVHSRQTRTTLLIAPGPSHLPKATYVPHFISKAEPAPPHVEVGALIHISLSYLLRLHPICIPYPTQSHPKRFHPAGRRK